VFSHSDQEWERWGKSNPYYGVLSSDQFLNSKITDADKESFFNSGTIHVNHVIDVIHTHFYSSLPINRALDFGCGVGRVIIPLAKFIPSVVGVDISSSMLRIADENCQSQGISNIDLIQSDDRLSQVTGDFDLIHSYIVFQHIPIARGMEIFRNLIGHLRPGGYGVFQFTINQSNILKKIYLYLKQIFPIVGCVVNLIHRRSFFAPQMQMNSYNLTRILSTLKEYHVQKIYMEMTDQDGYMGATIYFQIPGQ
jgi:2-polyprenyl-3-methyl-5-hydroxy-6-metoxy-1,4-benzoquinol methylase